LGGTRRLTAALTATSPSLRDRNPTATAEKQAEPCPCASNPTVWELRANGAQARQAFSTQTYVPNAFKASSRL